MKHHRVKASHDNYVGHLSVNGFDLSHIVAAGFSIKFPDHKERLYAPTIEVELISDEFEFDGEAVIHLSEKAEAALAALGWTPPPQSDDVPLCGDGPSRLCSPESSTTQQTQEQTP